MVIRTPTGNAAAYLHESSRWIDPTEMTALTGLLAGDGRRLERTMSLRQIWTSPQADLEVSMDRLPAIPDPPANTPTPPPPPPTTDIGGPLSLPVVIGRFLYRHLSLLTATMLGFFKTSFDFVIKTFRIFIVF